MYTQCSDCLTIYKVQVETLQQSLGKFRCGHCGSVFDAIPTLIEKLPEGRIEELPRASEIDAPTVLNVPALRPVPKRALMPPEEPKKDPEIDLANLFDPSDRKEPTLPADWVVFTPSSDPQGTTNKSATNKKSAEPATREQRYRAEAKQLDAERAAKRLQKDAPLPLIVDEAEETPRGPWLIGSVFLCLCLLAQLGFYQRDYLLAHDDFRPAIESVCRLIGCQLPLRESLSEIVLLDGSVKKHETAAGALIVSATLRNNADFVQPYPVVEVKLLSASNQVIALRRFEPAQYLSSANAEAEGVPAQAVLPVVFEVLDPGKAATGFEFNFLSARR